MTRLDPVRESQHDSGKIHAALVQVHKGNLGKWYRQIEDYQQNRSNWLGKNNSNKIITGKL